MYNLDWLLAKYNQHEKLKYLFFWGHTQKKPGVVDQSCFSQWFVSPFVVDGITYATAEHWMMAGKAKLFGDEAVLQEILASTKPGEVKALGRKVKNFDPEVWEQACFNIVVEGNYHKFSQNEEMKDFLLKTGELVIVEASPVDAIWGIGMAKDHANVERPDLWRGTNLLGFALTEVRDRLK